MTKIKEVVQINSGYTSYVDLFNDYHDLVKNRGRMSLYKPIAAHRKVFERISNSLNPLDRRFYFLSGSYGTGKSHLLLMLANFFACQSDLPELEAFFSNYEVAQSEVLLKPGESLKERSAASLKKARKSGRYLVAICRFSLNLDFEGSILRALQDALAADESAILLDTHYNEALRRIRDWKDRSSESRFYSDFEAAISKKYPDWTINDLQDGLNSYQEPALSAFKQCFLAVTDSEFTYKKDNLRDIITDFLQNQEFKKKYQGIVILYDEFGAAIDNNLVNYTTLLDFAQFCASSTLEKGGPVIFIGSGHKTFRNHGQIGDLNAETLEARVSEIGLETQGMEDIIAAIVQPDKGCPDWAEHIETQSGKFTWFSGECNRLHLFNWLPAPKIKNNIIQNIYPMHPLATFALLKLSGVAGSDNRSVFKFFAPEFETGEQGWINVQEFSYPWFLETHEIVEDGKLALYTPDILVDYFSDSLKATNSRLMDRAKTAVINFEATLRELNAYIARKSESQLFEEVDDLMLRIIKVMLVNEIASSADVAIANTLQNINFALDAVSPEESTQVEDRVSLLSNAGILFNNDGVYELIRGDRKDIQRLVDQYKANPENRPANLLQGFTDLISLRNDEVYLEAKDYNTAYNEDKRLKVHFATPAMLNEKKMLDGEALSFYSWKEWERQHTTGLAKDYEGSAIYVLCEQDNDVDAAKKQLSKNDQERVVVAVPRVPISIYDAIYTLKALDSEWFREQAQSFSPYEKVEEKKIRDVAITCLKDAKVAYFSNSRVLWFGKDGNEIPAKDAKRFDVADHIMMNIYGGTRNTFGHNEFNKTHIKMTGQVRAIFKEAGDILCDLTQPVRINWSWPDNRGGTKYVRKCFVDHQLLSVLNVEGDNRFLEPERNLAKFRSAIPAYAKLLEDLASLEGKDHENLLHFLRPYFVDYGQGEISMTLLLLLARRFYGDSLRFKREPNTLTDIQFISTDEMLALLQGESPSAVILFEKVSKEDQSYFSKIVQIYTNKPAPAGKVYTVAEAYRAINDWWDFQPVIARSLGFYEEEDKALAEALSQAKTKDPFRFIKFDLMELLGITPGEVLTAAKLKPVEIRLKTFKSITESVQSTVEERILSAIAEVFGANSELDIDIQETIRNWHNSLTSAQKDPLGSYHNNDSKPLVKNTGYANIRELLFKDLPEAYSLGSVDSWISDYVSPYIDRIRSGKKHIETNAPQISGLIIDVQNEHVEHGNQITYQGELVLNIRTEDDQGAIYYTEDNSDPTSSKQRKKLVSGASLTVTGNQKLRFAVADAKGNYSAVRMIEAINELEKYSIKRPDQQSAFDETVTFVFPKTKDSAQNTVFTFVKSLIDSGIFTTAELMKVVKEALGSINSGSKGKK